MRTTKRNGNGKALAALLSRQAKEEREIRARLKAAEREIKRARPEFLRPAQEALRALLTERRRMAERHRKERMEAAAAIRAAAGEVAQTRKAWPATLARRADQLRAFSGGTTALALEKARRELEHSATWKREVIAASQAKRHAAQVKSWGKRVSPSKVLAKMRGAVDRKLRPAEFIEQARNAADYQIATHYPELSRAWRGYLKRTKPFTETKRRAWVASAKKGRNSADYWGEREAELFKESVDPADWSGDELSDAAINALAFQHAKASGRVPAEWADFPFDE